MILNEGEQAGRNALLNIYVLVNDIVYDSFLIFKNTKKNMIYNICIFLNYIRQGRTIESL